MTDRDKLAELLASYYGVDPAYYGIDAYMIADHFLANGATFAKDTNVPSWIPVSERLPEENGRYLCSGKFRGNYYQRVMFGDQYGFREGCVYTDNVSHWMPLPEPPKED